MTAIQRFPKWLLQESFELSYEPTAQRYRIVIRLFDDRRQTVFGHGPTICDAANNARQKREEDT